MIDNTSKEYVSAKPCCSVCDRQKVCHVCGAQTLMACADCRMNFKAVVYVCTKPECRDAHERMCYGTGTRETDGEFLRKQRDEALAAAAPAALQAMKLRGALQQIATYTRCVCSCAACAKRMAAEALEEDQQQKTDGQSPIAKQEPLV